MDYVSETGYTVVVVVVVKVLKYYRLLNDQPATASEILQIPSSTPTWPITLEEEGLLLLRDNHHMSSF